MTRVGCALLVLSWPWLLPIGTAAAGTAPLADPACPPPLSRPAVATDPQAFQDRLRTRPDAALQLACERQRRQPQATAAALDVAEALIALTQGAAAARTLQAVAADAAAGPASLQGRWHLLKARLSALQERQLSAADDAERALALLPADDPLWPDALLQRARSLIALGRPDELPRAEALIGQVEQALQRQGRAHSLPMAAVLGVRTLLANAQGDFAAVERWARAEWLLVRKLQGRDSPLQLDALASLGAMVSTGRRYEETLRVLEEGRRIGRLHPQAQRSAYIGILNNLSPTLLDLGRVDEALQVSEEALAAARLHWGIGSSRTLTPLNRRSSALEAAQLLVRAGQDHEEILAILDREGEQVRIERRLRLLDNAAAFHMRMGDFDEADRQVRRALAITADGRGGAYWRGRALNRQARLQAERGAWAQAEQIHAQAIDLMTPAYGALHPYLTLAHARRCEAQLQLGGPSPSCDQVQAGLGRLVDAGAIERAAARLALAQAARHRQAADEELVQLRHALAAAQADDGLPLLWSVFDRLSQAQRAAGRHGLAVLLGKLAVDHIEGVRGALRPLRELDAGFVHDKLPAYRRLADWLVEDGRVDEALEVLALLRGEEVRAFVRGLAESAAGRAVSLTVGEQRWLAASPLAMPQRGPGPASDAAARLQLEQQRASTWARAFDQPVAAAPRTDGRHPTKRPAARPAGPPGTLQATLFFGPAHLNLVMDSAAGRSVWRQRMDAAAVVRDIGRLLRLIESRADAQPLLESLHARLAAPLEAEARRVGASHLSLRLDGDLRYLPFAALHDGRGHLVERLAVVQRAGPQAAARPAARPAGAAWAQAFGVTQAVRGWPALPAVADELCAVVDGGVEGQSVLEAAACRAAGGRSGLPGQGWLNEAFTRDRLRAALRDGREGRFDLLHLATHFQLRPGRINQSWLLLGDGSELPLNELLTWPLRSQEVVTLSACQTALGGGAEMEGLAALLLGRGAASVLASLWPVGDRSTSELMREFYARLSAGTAPERALQAAQLHLLRSADARRRHPAAWAAFQLTAQ